MWIKICANTNLEDALLAAELGADAVGFVFAPSPRRVTPAQAGVISAHLPSSIVKVGVFSAWPAEGIVEAVEEAKLTTIQLHGTPNPELIRTVHTHFAGRIAIIQVLHWNVDALREQAGEIMRQIDRLTATLEIDSILIDSKAGFTTGGTGIPFAWEKARTLFASHPKIVLAGGLNPNNVVQAIGQLRPWGVDVASGVEAAPGRKDLAKLEAFIHAARNAANE